MKSFKPIKIVLLFLQIITKNHQLHKQQQPDRSIKNYPDRKIEWNIKQTKNKTRINPKGITQQPIKHAPLELTAENSKWKSEKQIQARRKRIGEEKTNLGKGNAEGDGRQRERERMQRRWWENEKSQGTKWEWKMELNITSTRCNVNRWILWFSIKTLFYYCFPFPHF